MSNSFVGDILVASISAASAAQAADNESNDSDDDDLDVDVDNHTNSTDPLLFSRLIAITASGMFGGVISSGMRQKC